jgi:hypothetical protein
VPGVAGPIQWRRSVFNDPEPEETLDEAYERQQRELRRAQAKISTLEKTIARLVAMPAGGDKTALSAQSQPTSDPDSAAETEGSPATALQRPQKAPRLVQTAAPKPRRKRITKAEANEEMLHAVQDNPDRLKWSVREWGLHVGCSTSTIAKTAMWQQGAKARAKAKQERMPRSRGRQKRRHYSAYDKD